MVNFDGILLKCTDILKMCLTTGEGVHLLEMQNFDFNFIFTKSSKMIMGF